MASRKICVVTGSRAEYGLLYPVMKEIAEDPSLRLQIVATGMHLSPEFGLTYKEVEKDFAIDKKIEMLLSSDTSIGISKSMGLAQISFAEAYEELKPDIVLLLGDRYEIFSAASAAMVSKIPIGHINGGETTEGAFDEAIRHCITKMSHIHFAATEIYRKRIIQLGESPDRVFNVGDTAIDNIKNLELLSREDFERRIGIRLNQRNLMVTFHPVTLEDGTSESQFKALLEALDALEETTLIFTKSNSDTDGRVINNMIDAYVAAHPDKAVAFTSLGYLAYLSGLKYVDAVVGNSSSGIIEAPAFKIGTINIGDRQKGRLRVPSIIDCEPDKESITQALKELYSEEFKEKLDKMENIYGDGTAGKRICRILKEIDLSDILKKRFYDLKAFDEQY